MIENKGKEKKMEISKATMLELLVNSSFDGLIDLSGCALKECIEWLESQSGQDIEEVKAIFTGELEMRKTTYRELYGEEYPTSK